MRQGKRMAVGPVCTLLALVRAIGLPGGRHVRVDVENGLVSRRPAVRVHTAAHSQPPHQRLAHHAIPSLRAKEGFHGVHIHGFCTALCTQGRTTCSREALISAQAGSLL